MVSPHHGRGAFDGRVAGMEAVVALERGLLKAEASGLFAPGELLVTAVSTKDMLTCYAGGGCENVLGAPAESFIHTSLLDGLHAEDVRNLVFAFHLFPTILPEVINRVGAPRSTARSRERTGSVVPTLRAAPTTMYRVPKPPRRAPSPGRRNARRCARAPRTTRRACCLSRTPRSCSRTATCGGGWRTAASWRWSAWAA